MKIRSLHYPYPNSQSDDLFGDIDREIRLHIPAIGTPAIGTPAIGTPAIGTPPISPSTDDLSAGSNKRRTDSALDRAEGYVEIWCNKPLSEYTVSSDAKIQTLESNSVEKADGEREGTPDARRATI